jgi:hypothetical protein
MELSRLEWQLVGEKLDAEWREWASPALMRAVPVER